MLRLTKKDIGQPFVVEFLDHVENGKEPAPTRAYGELVEFNRRKVVITAWFYPGDPKSDNTTVYAIARSTITSMIKLVRGV